MKILPRPQSALLKPVGLGSARTAYLLYFLCKRKMEMLRVLKSREDGFSPLSQRESFHHVKGVVGGGEKTDKAVWEISEVGDHAKRLLTLKLFKKLHCILRNNVMYALKDEDLVQWSAVEEF